MNAVDALEAGNETIAEIADALGNSESHTSRKMKELAEDPTSRVARDDSGRPITYHLEEPEAVEETMATVEANAQTEPVDGDADGTKRMLTNRSDDWSREVAHAASAGDYVPSGNEYVEAMSLVFGSNDDTADVLWFTGDPGTGKTLLARNIAQELDFPGHENAPLFTIQGGFALSESDILGSPTLGAEGKSWWVDGTLTKGLRASQEGPTVILFDEPNRAAPEALGSFFSALDARCSVKLEGPRGGEIIQGDPSNLIVVCTTNEGRRFDTQPLDPALKERLSNKWELDFLGEDYPDREAQVVADSVDTDDGEEFPPKLARIMVKAANEVRELAGDDDSPIRAGISTRKVVSWAETAWDYGNADENLPDHIADTVENPVMRAADSNIIEPLYEGREADEVTDTLREHLDEAGVDVESFTEWADEPEDLVECPSCGWEGAASDHERVELENKCPECGGFTRESPKAGLSPFGETDE